MISIQLDFDRIHFSDIFYFKDDEKEKRIRMPLGKSKDVYLIVKREILNPRVIITDTKLSKEETEAVQKKWEKINLL